MATIVTRAGKGSELTTTEADANFTNLNTDKAEATISGSYTGTGVGFSSSPTVTIYYRVVGNVVFLETRSILTGTSNDVVFTITGAPAGIRPASTTGDTFIRVTNNGSASAGLMRMDSSGTLTLAPSMTATAFTASGTKAAQTFTMHYLLVLP